MQLDKDEEELQVLRKENDILKGYVQKVVGPIDLANPKKVIKVVLERQALTPLSSLL